jgi:hypothetical protein
MTKVKEVFAEVKSNCFCIEIFRIYTKKSSVQEEIDYVYTIFSGRVNFSVTFRPIQKRGGKPPLFLEKYYIDLLKTKSKFMTGLIQM